ncbi:MAG: transposase [Verrucomicrobia bacterium]|nr:transposase [Verrucomicrobiota bacterium]
MINRDPCLARGLGYSLPKATAARTFLDRFHDEALEALRPPREEQKSVIVPSSPPVEGLQRVQAGLVGRVAHLYEEQQRALKIATIDQDATIIESHKEAARPHYEGGRGYQPMVAVWGGGRPGGGRPISGRQCAGPAGAVDLRANGVCGPAPSVQARYFRGDSACYEHRLISWLRHSDRALEKGGAIGFAVSAVLSQELALALASVPAKQWQTFATEGDGTRRQWAEVDFVPGEKSERTDSRPLRYVGLRLRKAQGVLFADGADRHHHAVLTNLDWPGDRLLDWHREKAGTVEQVHDEVKNALGGGHLPSQHFNVNAAWFKLALLTYNLASAIRGLCFAPEERNVRFKKFRLLLIHLAGRFSRFGCTLRLRFCAPREAIGRVQKVWEVFVLPTQATAFG